MSNILDILANSTSDLALDLAPETVKTKSKRGTPDTDAVLIMRLPDVLPAPELVVKSFIALAGIKAPNRHESLIIRDALNGERKAVLALASMALATMLGQSALANDKPRGRGGVSPASADENANALVILGY